MEDNDSDGKRKIMDETLPRKKTTFEADLDTLLQLYYQRLFPSSRMHNWLSYGEVDPNYFCNRELSFTLKGDIYTRFRSFANEKEFREELLKENPVKIDIGAIYTNKPKMHKSLTTGGFYPVEKEMVFDIDLTDYDDIRTCCSEANICKKCWSFMSVAIQIIDSCLREDFGFEMILWVYSGRRGVHCWVCDERARKMSYDGRSAIAEYISVIRGGNQDIKKVRLPNETHPSLSRAYDFASNVFSEHVIEEQRIFDSKNTWSKVLQLIPEKAIQDQLEESWSKTRLSGHEKWEQLKNLVTETYTKSKKKNHFAIIRDIVFQYTYPRLDINVSKHLNHLLKSPFCVHPSTGRVCVPIDPATCDLFDPSKVPTVSQLLLELDDYQSKDFGDSQRLSDFKKTSLKPYIDLFDQFLKPIQALSRQIKRDESERDLQF